MTKIKEDARVHRRAGRFVVAFGEEARRERRGRIRVGEDGAAVEGGGDSASNTRARRSSLCAESQPQETLQA